MPTLQRQGQYIDFTKVDVGDLDCGTQIIDALTGKFFALVSSFATIDNVNVVAVANRPDLRWQFTGQIAGVPLGAATWLQLSKIWASTIGSDSNDGTGETSPVQSVRTGLLKLVALGGGTLYLDDGVTANLASSAGIWVRGDTFAVPGFVNIPSTPIRIVGRGRTQGVGPFLSGPQAKFTGGPGGRNSPDLWVVGPLNSPFRVEFLQPAFAHQVGARIGVDYDRNADGTERALTVSSATRSGTATVYTVTLPAGFPATLGVSDVSGNVTLTVPNAGLLPWPPFKGGSIVRIASTNVNFPSGDYTVKATSNFVTSPIPSIWTLTYNDGGTTRGSQAVAGTTVSTHGCPVGDFIDLSSTSGNFEGTQYQVTAITATTITVVDVFGNGNVTNTNIGTLTHQERFAGGTSMFEAYKCGFACDNTDALAGPAWDIGHTAAIAPVLDSCWMAGYVGAGQLTPRDELRMSAALVTPGVTGSLGPGLAGIYARHCRGAGGSINVNAPANGIVDVRDFLVETSFQALGLPALRVQGTFATEVFGQDIANADSANATVIVSGVPPAGVWLERCGTVVGSCIGGDSWQNPGNWKPQGADAIASPWTLDQGTAWADLRSSFKHPGAPRAMGVVGARFANTIVPATSWSLPGSTTRTTGKEAPDGSLTAVQLDAAATAYNQIKANGADGATWTAGGYLVFCGWINSLTPNAFNSDDGIRVVTSDITFQDGLFSMVFPYFGRGWQFVQMKLKVATVASTTPSYILNFFAAGSTSWQLWGITSFYVPNTFQLNDIAEYMGTLKHQPSYLPKGMSGTMEGGKLIAHGGMGIDTSVPKVAGVSSGQLTVGAITTYEPRYAADGVTIIGWAALFAATVNP